MIGDCSITMIRYEIVGTVRLEFSVDSSILTQNVFNYELSLNLNMKKVLNRQNSFGIRDCDQCKMDHDDHKSVWEIFE